MLGPEFFNVTERDRLKAQPSCTESLTASFKDFEISMQKLGITISKKSPQTNSAKGLF